MSKKPFFSIVIPTYNRASDLEFALFCTLRQNFSDFEVVISDNCSSDATNEVVANLKDKRIRYFRNNKNLHMVKNQKKAVEYARGQYIFIHGDDDFLPYTDSLGKIYTKIIKHNVGYMRINYVSLSTDKRNIFNYKVNKSFIKDTYLAPNAENKKILDFIIDSDPYFITGIIFRNDLQIIASMIDTDPVPWIEILFSAVKQAGGYFFTQPQIVASWSHRVIKRDDEHHLYRLFDGKLKSESYFNAVKNKISERDYFSFLHRELMSHYISLLPVIKAHVGNKIMLQLVSRIHVLDPAMKRDRIYWFYVITALIIPRFLLKQLRIIALYLYKKFSIVDDEEQLVNAVKKAEFEFLAANKSKNKKQLFQM